MAQEETLKIIRSITDAEIDEAADNGCPQLIRDGKRIPFEEAFQLF